MALLVLSPATVGATSASPPPDPPTQVARLARVGGTVTIRDGSEPDWRRARPNIPLPSGTAIWVEDGGRALLDAGANRIGMAARTEIRLDRLDDTLLEATLTLGEVYLRLDCAPACLSVRVHTPRGTVEMADDGRYAIVAGDAGQPTIMTVFDGTARWTAGDATEILRANQAATLTGEPAAGPSATGHPPFRSAIGPARRNGFAVAMMAEDPRIDPLTPDSARQMTGIGDLARFGAWRITRDFGAVWVPRVETGWTPYRDGTWAWVEPWGWTWIDDATWGFAPFHYGRWAVIAQGEEPAWAWVPAMRHAGPAFRPAYAPALVAFLAPSRAQDQSGTNRPGRPGMIGWAPLSPGQAYSPAYAASVAYRWRLDAANVRNPQAREVGAARIDPAAATVVPVWAMTASRPSQLAHVDARELTRAHLEPLAPADLPRPSRASLGMTPTKAARLGLIGQDARPPLRPAGTPAGTNDPRARIRQAAPGPLIVPRYPGLYRAPAPPDRPRDRSSR